LCGSSFIWSGPGGYLGGNAIQANGDHGGIIDSTVIESSMKPEMHPSFNMSSLDHMSTRPWIVALKKKGFFPSYVQ